VDWVLYRLALARFRHDRWTSLSAGYKMRFELARALVRDPALLLLDEPLGPLDIVARYNFVRDLRQLASLRPTRMAIILTSQELYTVEAIADIMLVMEDGIPLFYGPPTMLGADRDKNVFEIEGPTSPKDLSAALSAVDGTVQRSGMGFLVTVSRSVSADTVLAALTSSQVLIRYFRDVSESSRVLFERRKGHQ
jgi:ABC-2 type transport system ATP-binding protein